MNYDLSFFIFFECNIYIIFQTKYQNNYDLSFLSFFECNIYIIFQTKYQNNYVFVFTIKEHILW